jgi:tRNA (Thr-GGU) A37 N-methylase
VTRNHGTTNLGKRPQLRPIGEIRSTLTNRSKAPKQGSEGAPDAWLEVKAFAAPALQGLQPGDQIIVMTFHEKTGRSQVDSSWFW